MADIVTQSADGQLHSFPQGTAPTVIDKVMKDYAAQGAGGGAAAQPPQKADSQPSSFVDAIRSIPGGIGKGVAGIVGLPGDVSNLMDRGMDAITGANVSGHGPVPGRVTSQDVNNVISKPTGGYYQPQREAGKYAETIASFAPAGLAPGGIAMRAARVLVPAAASETAGELTEGTGIEPYARAAGALVGGLAAGPAIRSINALASRAGLPIQNPANAARSMMSDAVARDGGQQSVQQGLTDWRGNSNPALIDVTGNNVRRLVRGAASGGNGQAQNIATGYADRIAGNLQDNALALSRNLTPGETRGATQYGADLEAAQKTDAETNYKGPYSQPATVTKEMVSALQGPEGRGAISQAYADARANRNSQQMAELKDLQEVASEGGATPDPLTGQKRSLPQALSELTSGSLDRVRIAMRDTGRALAANGRNSRAGGYFGRVNDIDTALDQTPGLNDARASYKDFARQQDAVELGKTGLNASPEDYGASIMDLSKGSPKAPQAAGIGYRQALTDAISRPAEGATGILNRVSTSTAQTRNLAATYGQSAAKDYQTGVGNEIDRISNSRFISPNAGSQTQPRAEDAGLIDLPLSTHGIIAHIWDRVKSGAQLTEQERTALVRMGTTEARLVNIARTNPSLTTRALSSALLGRSGGNQQ